MYATRYRSTTFADGGAFPVSLRALLSRGIQRIHETGRRSHERVIGGIVFDGGTFPQRFTRTLKRRWKRSAKNSGTDLLGAIAQRPEHCRHLRKPAPGAPPIRRWVEEEVIDAEIIRVNRAPVTEEDLP